MIFEVHYYYLQISACVRKIGDVSQEFKIAFSSNSNFNYVILLEDLSWDSRNAQQLFQEEPSANLKPLDTCLTFYGAAVLDSLKNVYNVDAKLGYRYTYTTLTDPSEFGLHCLRFNSKMISGDPLCQSHTFTALDYGNILENSFYTNRTTWSTAGYCKRLLIHEPSSHVGNWVTRHNRLSLRVY